MLFWWGDVIVCMLGSADGTIDWKRLFQTMMGTIGSADGVTGNKL